MKGTALLLGRPDLPTIEALAAELPRHGLAPRVLDPRSFPATAFLSVWLDERGRAHAAFDGVPIDDARVGFFTSHTPIQLARATARPARAFARAASVAAMLSLRQARRIPWINDPWNAARSSDKLLQLALAARHGLMIPETLLTSDPAAFRRFVRAHGSAAVKSPSGSAGLPESQRILTQRVTTRDLGDADDVRLAPVLAQEYVEKRTVVRATVVGSRVFAAEIHSQQTRATRIDWRRYHPKLRYSKMELPAAVRRACAQVTRDCGLAYSGIDLVRTPKDEYVFLEANSEPAWLWLEDATGLPMTRAIARMLATHARAR